MALSYPGLPWTEPVLKAQADGAVTTAMVLRLTALHICKAHALGLNPGGDLCVHVCFHVFPLLPVFCPVFF